MCGEGADGGGEAEGAGDAGEFGGGVEGDIEAEGGHWCGGGVEGDV